MAGATRSAGPCWPPIWRGWAAWPPTAPPELLSRYGTRARPYCAGLAGRGETTLAAVAGYSREEIAHLCRTERVVTLEDVLRRRTLIALTSNDSPKVRAEIAAILSDLRRPQPARGAAQPA